MWFKNLYLYKFERPIYPEWEHALSQKPFTPCAPTQRESLGWVPPLGGEATAFTHSANGVLLMTLARQGRVVPAHTLREAVAAKIAAMKLWEPGRKVGTKEKKELTQQVEEELLPQVFPKTSKMDAFITPDGEWLVIDTPSATRAEAFVTALRKTVGSVPVAPMKVAGVSSTLTRWLSEYRPPEPFKIGDECELVSDDSAAVAFRKHELGTKEVAAHIESGKLVSKLALTWDKKISFLLADDLTIKKLKFLDVLEDQMEEEDPQSHEEQLDIEFTLMTGELVRVIRHLDKQFG